MHACSSFCLPYCCRYTIFYVFSFSPHLQFKVHFNVGALVVFSSFNSLSLLAYSQPSCFSALFEVDNKYVSLARLSLELRASIVAWKSLKSLKGNKSQAQHIFTHTRHIHTITHTSHTQSHTSPDQRNNCFSSWLPCCW